MIYDKKGDLASKWQTGTKSRSPRIGNCLIAEGMLVLETANITQSRRKRMRESNSSEKNLGVRNVGA
ncbi:MAG: hypothetical protein NPIRA06_02500 [Nitrospirales bacterium]|nr:MAG: hypothetical protein NPIRA06_02500 [Nitrospirales bacterium]